MNRQAPIISASVTCANALALDSDLRALEEAEVDYVHIDMADGHFVPNLGVGLDLAKQIKQATKIPLDLHLMVSNPEVWAPRVLGELRPAIVAFHIEPMVDTVRLARTIRDLGALAGAAINPGTPVSALESLLEEIDLVLVMTVCPGFAGQTLVPSALNKISDLRRRILENHLDVPIMVDGNASFEYAPRMREAGADIFVCGSSSVFQPKLGIVAATEAFRRCLAQPSSKLVSRGV